MANEVYVVIPDPKKVIRHPGGDGPASWVGGVKTQTIPSGKLKKQWKIPHLCVGNTSKKTVPPFHCYVRLQECILFGFFSCTPPKFNMESENDGFQEEPPFLGTSFQVPC